MKTLVEIASSLTKNSDGITTYPAITAQQLNTYVDSLETYEIFDEFSRFERPRINPRWSPKVVQDLGHFTKSVYYENKPAPPDIVDPTKTAIVNKVIQQGADLFHVAITEQSINDYKGIPPYKVLDQLKSAWRSGEFDELVVLEPEMTKMQEPLIYDPLFCGKKRSEPGVYYYISGWLQDISLGKFIMEGELIQLEASHD